MSQDRQAISQDQQATTGTSPTNSLAADMPRVPGAETAKSIIENAVRPHDVPQPATAVAGNFDPFVDQDIDIPLMGETLTFTKRTVVTEEVRLSKRRVTQEQNVADTVRRERVSVQGADVVAGADSETPATTGDTSTQHVSRRDHERRHDGNALEGLDQKIDHAIDKLFGGHRDDR